MPRCLTVAPHLPTDELERHCRDAIERSHEPEHVPVAAGHRMPAMATLTGYSVN